MVEEYFQLHYFEAAAVVVAAAMIAVVAVAVAEVVPLVQAIQPKTLGNGKEVLVLR